VVNNLIERFFFIGLCDIKDIDESISTAGEQQGWLASVELKLCDRICVLSKNSTFGEAAFLVSLVQRLVEYIYHSPRFRVREWIPHEYRHIARAISFQLNPAATAFLLELHTSEERGWFLAGL